MVKNHHLVVSALEALSAANNEAGNPYGYRFKSLESVLAGRGKMGTLVGASDEVKRHGGIDPSLNDYTVCVLHISANVLLMYLRSSPTSYSSMHS